MITVVKKRALFAAATLATILAVSHISQPTLALTNGGSITTLGVALSENFDNLAQALTGITWSDNTTLPGVYATRVTYNSGTGSSNAGALYSFGVAGAGTVGDRALGSVGSGATGIVYWGVKLTNNTGATITSLTVQYIGEQWRNGGATTPNVSVAQTVDFQYRLAATGIDAPQAGWTDYDPLDFTSPTFGTTTAATLTAMLPPTALRSRQPFR